MTIKANRRTRDPQGTQLSLYSQGSHPDPPVSSASAPTALLNREIRDGKDSPTAAQILRLTQNPRKKKLRQRWLVSIDPMLFAPSCREPGQGCKDPPISTITLSNRVFLDSLRLRRLRSVGHMALLL